MNQEIATWTFYTLVVVTLGLQFVMWYKRSRFLRSIKGQRGELLNLKGSKIEELRTMLQVVIPVKLCTASRGQELRKSAVKASNYWIISLILTLIVPIIIFSLSK